jgi:hypothetical protein
MKGPDKDKWENVVFEEHKRMVKNQVWRAVPKKDVTKNAKVMTSTWAMKKKSNGTYRAILNARVYEHVDGIHYDSSNISSPVINDATSRIILVLMIIFKWSAQLVDVKGAFYVEISKMEKRFSWKYRKDLKNFMERMFCYYYCKQYMD